MTDAGFVITAWTLTAVVLIAYVAMLFLRIRRGERSLDSPDPRR
ncbi:MAG TPA: hypothetical protein VIC35_01815 [Acidimicrobiia bacterium]|jgi:isoprenylcysteine carboxyl methyltransferase (ICMT) family protein YpbQ